MSMRMLRDDRGFALATVMGAIVLLTVVSLAAFALSRNAVNDASRVQAGERAFQVAQSGLDREVAVFAPGNITSPTYFPRRGTTSDGTYVVTATNGTSGGGLIGEYIMTSVGTSGDTTESVSLRFFYLDLWSMNMGAGKDTNLGYGRGFQGNAYIWGPLYIRGDLSWGGNGTYEGGPLFVRGNLIADGSGDMGKINPLDLYVSGYIDDTGKQNVFYKSLSSSVPDIELPWIDNDYLNTAKDEAITQSTDNIMGGEGRTIETTECISGVATTYSTALAPALNPRVQVSSTPANPSQYYKYVGNPSSHASLGNGAYAVNIDTTSFGAWAGNGYPAASGLHDDFAYDAATGTLYVEGTVFIDGSLFIGDNVKWYVGNGKLVVNGPVSIQGDLMPASASTDLEQDYSLGICTPSDITFGASNNTAHMRGSVFTNGTFGMYGAQGSDPSNFDGAVLAGTIYGDKPNIHLTMNPLVKEVLPDGMPGSGGGLVFSGTWSRQ